jgi:hypothetical protein
MSRNLDTGRVVFLSGFETDISGFEKYTFGYIEEGCPTDLEVKKEVCTLKSV